MGNESVEAVAQTGQMCQNCGKKPGRPKFCGRSCAATYNNKANPKRRPEGKCDRCGTPCQRAKRYCERCLPVAQAEAQEERRRAEENIQTWQSPKGQPVEMPVPRVHVHQSVVFDTGRYSEAWTLQDPCGPLLDHLIGVVFARPAYIHPADVHRYASLIHEFGQFVFERRGWEPRPKKQTVNNTPLGELEFALRRWIESKLDDGNPLMSSFALDAAEFVVAHAWGDDRRLDHGERWKISRLVSGESARNRGAYDPIHDKELKRGITERMGSTVVRGRILSDGRIDGGGDGPAVPPGTPFYFQISRCHLSEGWYDHNLWDHRYRVKQDIAFDIAEEFAFPGILLLRQGHPMIEGRQPGHLGKWLTPDLTLVAESGVQVRIPVRWLTHWVEFRRSDEPPTEKPLPGWSGDHETLGPASQPTSPDDLR